MKKFFETTDSFKILDMVRCLITEGHSVRIQVMTNANPIMCTNNLYVIYLEDEEQ